MVARFDSESDCYGWNNESYYFSWRHPNWKLTGNTEYLVKVKVISAGIRCQDVFKLHIGKESEDFKLEQVYKRDKDKLIQEYSYAKMSGKIFRYYGLNMDLLFKRVIRAIPFFGLLSIFYKYPLKNHFLLLPFYIPFAFVNHIVCIFGFWKGFFTSKKELKEIF